MRLYQVSRWIICFVVLFCKVWSLSAQYDQCIVHVFENENLVESSKMYVEWVKEYPDVILIETYADWFVHIYRLNKEVLDENEVLCLLEQAVKFYLEIESKSIDASFAYFFLIGSLGLDDQNNKASYYSSKINTFYSGFEMRNSIDSMLVEMVEKVDVKTEAGFAGTDSFNPTSLINDLRYKYRAENVDISSELDEIQQEFDNQILNKTEENEYSQFLFLQMEYAMHLLGQKLSFHQVVIENIDEFTISLSRSEVLDSHFRSFQKSVKGISLMLDEYLASNASFSTDMIFDVEKQKFLFELFTFLDSKTKTVKYVESYFKKMEKLSIEFDSREYLLIASQMVAVKSLLGDDFAFDESYLFSGFNTLNQEFKSSVDYDCSVLGPTSALFDSFIDNSRIFRSFDICQFSDLMFRLLEVCPVQKGYSFDVKETSKKLIELCGYRQQPIQIDRVAPGSYSVSHSAGEYSVHLDEVSIVNEFNQDLNLDKKLMPLNILDSMESRIIEVESDGVYDLIDVRFIRNNDKYIFESYDIEYLVICEDLKLENTLIPSHDYVAFGGIQYDMSNSTEQFGALNFRGDNWINLPESKEEIENTAKFFDDPILFQQELATETSFYSNSSSKILHFATHGFIDDNNESALVLLSDQKNDGYLTASEISKLDLSSTELVVLSACNTGTIESVESNFNSTLAGAFLKAGAKKVLFSRDKVNDYYAKEFISRFFKYYSLSENVNVSFTRCLREMYWEYPEQIGKWAIFNFVSSKSL